ncbi:MAG: phospholipase D family protein [Pseudomonadota bacterium]
MSRAFRLLSLSSAVLLLVACGSVPFDYPRDESSALSVDHDTALGRLSHEWHTDNAGHNGFFGLSGGAEALGARLRMMEVAERSIDAQYFIIKRDRAGGLFAGKMLSAADRGVRVRLLIDDIFSPGVDHPLSVLSSHPNIEVRLFNPVSRKGFKWSNFLFDFKRANRRMHNKSFTVDNTMSIVGGRNIGEEYFELNQGVKFDDYEVLTIGPVVEDISAGFDAYWNSELSVPIEAFGETTTAEELDEWRDWIAGHIKGAQDGIYAKAVNSKLLVNIREGRAKPVIAKATLVTDSPEKLTGATGDASLATLAVEIGRRFREAEREIIIVTPYFIPQDSGAKIIEDILSKGVRVIIVTNSLASTNHVPVHSRYRGYRKRLLKAGAEIYEIRADDVGGENEWGGQPEMITLHSKATVIDRSTIFVGSLNFDPRSIVINTEMGLFIESEDTGAAFTEIVLKSLEETSYRVELDDGGKLRWVYGRGADQEIVYSEPLASAGRKAMVNLYRLLPIESQL